MVTLDDLDHALGKGVSAFCGDGGAAQAGQRRLHSETFLQLIGADSRTGNL